MFRKLDLLIEPCILQGNGGVVGQRREQVLVILRKAPVGLPIVYGEDTNGLIADEQRHLENRPHEEAGLHFEASAATGLIQPHWLAGTNDLTGERIVNRNAEALGALIAQILRSPQIEFVLLAVVQQQETLLGLRNVDPGLDDALKQLGLLHQTRDRLADAGKHGEFLEALLE